MIPKIIHYCWLSGDPYPDKIRRCIESWKMKLPDYEFVLWDTKRFDVNSVLWTKEAFCGKRYAFVSDYIRFFALFHCGGIYLDTDVEVLKSFDDLLQYDTVVGYEYTGVPEAAVVGSEKKQEWLKKCLEWYESHSFLDKNGRERWIVAPLILKYGYEKTMRVVLLDTGNVVRHDNYIVLPSEYLSAKNRYSGRISVSGNTYTVHHFEASWERLTLMMKIVNIIHIALICILGKKNYNKIVYAIREKRWAVNE
jgi:hypothetical protein